MKTVLKIIAAVILIVIGRFAVGEHLGNHLIADGVIFLISWVIVDVGKALIENRNHFWVWLQSNTTFFNKEVRVSIAYLYRIKVDGQYLLVKSRIRNSFQPVGGAFKSLPGSEKTFSKFEVRPDRFIETEHGIAKSDLRVYVKGRYLMPFLNWFKSRQDREISPWREFCEELISTEILPWKEFRHIDYKFMGMVESPIISLDSAGKGIFIFEIYDLLMNDEQKPILQKLLHGGNTDKYIWASDYLIQRLGHDETTKQYTYQIAPHAKYAHNLKWG